MPVIRFVFASLLWLCAQAVSAQPAGGVVFVGSSIIHRWTSLAGQMAPLQVVNLGVDGAVTADMLRALDSKVVGLRPKVIVYYCGSNDVDAGESASAIAERVRLFVARAQAALPDVRVIFLSVIRAPEKRDRWNIVDDVNRLVRSGAANGGRLEYLEVNPVLVDTSGAPRIELYMPDELHLRPQAYEALARIVKPAVAKALDHP